MSTRRQNWSLFPFSMRRERTIKAEVNESVDPEPFFRHEDGAEVPFTVVGRRLGGTVIQPNDVQQVEDIDGARIRDRRNGRIYEATIERRDGRPRLTALTILTTEPDDYINQNVMRSLPVQRIAEQVSLFLAETEASDSNFVVTTEGFREPGEITVEQVVNDVNEGLSRADIITRHQVSEHVVDRRLREARDKGLIPQAKTGRPRKTKPNEARKSD